MFTSNIGFAPSKEYLDFDAVCDMTKTEPIQHADKFSQHSLSKKLSNPERAPETY